MDFADLSVLFGETSGEIHAIMRSFLYTAQTSQE